MTWNDERTIPATVQDAAGGPVESVFTVVDQAGMSAGFFSSKTKFSLWDRSWPEATDTETIIEDNDDWWTLSRPTSPASRAGSGSCISPRPTWWVSRQGLHGQGLPACRAPRRPPRGFGAQGHPEQPLAGQPHHRIIVTADHGGKGRANGGHGDPTKVYNYTVPFMVWGAGVEKGTDLYDLNPDYLDPGRNRTTYSGTQPVRNGNVANLSLDLLGLGAVPGSEHDALQDLDVTSVPVTARRGAATG